MGQGAGPDGQGAGPDGQGAGPDGQGAGPDGETQGKAGLNMETQVGEPTGETGVGLMWRQGRGLI